MGIKAFLIECNASYWPEVARQLAAEHGWQPLYWAGLAKREAEVHALFPQAIFHDDLLALRGLPASAAASWSLPALDQELLTELAPGESIALRMMDRMDVDNCFHLYERVEHYHRCLRFWLGALEKLRPEVVLFGQMPHMAYDYVLYLLCRRRGVPTVFLDMSSLPGRLFPVSDIEQGCPPLLAAYQQKLARPLPERVALSAQSEAYLGRLTASYDQGQPAYMRKHFGRVSRDAATQGWKSRLVRLLHPWPAIRDGWRFLTDPAPANYLKAPGLPMDQSNLSGLQWRLLRRKISRRNQRLKEHYDSLTHAPERQRPYIFVALHYQPEKTTSPQGGVFVHQMLMVELLRESLPAGWWLYVKEAPAQFMPHVMRTSPAKDTHFYSRLASLPRVQLIPTEEPSFGLIDHSRAVATLTGTAGWEAIVRGKPALVFGHAWYRGCRGAFYTPTRTTCAQALAAIEQGEKVDPREVRLFVQALEEEGVWGYVEDHWGKEAGISPEENAAALTPAIHNFFLELRQEQAV